MRVTFKICTCMYKILHGLAPDYLNCAIVRNAPTRALRSASDATLLAVTVPRRTVGRGSFAVAGPTMWNSLPKSVRTNETLAVSENNKKLTYFVYTTCLDDTDLYSMTLLGFKLFCLELYFYTLIYCFITIYLS